jgi:hypothetical protein
VNREASGDDEGGSSTTALESGFRDCARNRGRFLSELTFVGGLELE